MAKVIKRLPTIPAERTLKVISGRWKASILYHLFNGPKRLSDLRRLAPAASQKVLVEQLREMEQHGVVHREVFRQVPARVDYTVTELGRSLQPVIMVLCEWGRRHAAELSCVDEPGDSRTSVAEASAMSSRTAVNAPETVSQLAGG
jgi:DNA-binding HxlR family transcriptional regulator